MIQETRGPGRFMMDDLESQYDQLAGRSGAIRLWIASSDPAMDSPMGRVRDAEVSLILRAPTEHLMKAPIEDAPVLRVLDRSIDRFNLRGIVVCGHSAQDVNRTQSPSPRPHLMASIGSKVLQGAQERMARNAWWKRQTVKYATALTETTSIGERIRRERLDFSTIFYLAESGVFTVFNEVSGEFEALYEGKTIQ